MHVRTNWPENLERSVLNDEFLVAVVVELADMDHIDATGETTDIQLHGLAIGHDMGDPCSEEVEYLHLIELEHVDGGLVVGGIGVEDHVFARFVHTNGDIGHVAAIAVHESHDGIDFVFLGTDGNGVGGVAGGPQIGFSPGGGEANRHAVVHHSVVAAM